LGGAQQDHECLALAVDGIDPITDDARIEPANQLAGVSYGSGVVHAQIMDGSPAEM
jgi:hypothetical protein